MNLYGDLGNVTTLVKRSHDRDIDIDLLDIKRGDKADFKYADLVFMGGGQDRGQKIITPDLKKRGKEIKEEIEKGLPALTICGGFQLFGKYFKTSDGETLEGISVFDAYTIGSNKRCIGNIVVNIGDLAKEWDTSTKTLVGFENHSGLTYVEGDTKPLGKVAKGYGNTGDSTFEGAVYKNCYGTYLHGPVLPKNPHFADYLILSALKRRYGKSAKLSPLDDTTELTAHKSAIARAKTAKTVHI